MPIFKPQVFIRKFSNFALMSVCKVSSYLLELEYVHNQTDGQTELIKKQRIGLKTMNLTFTMIYFTFIVLLLTYIIHQDLVVVVG